MGNNSSISRSNGGPISAAPAVRALVAAAQQGDLETVRYLARCTPKALRRRRVVCGDAAAHAAARNGHLAVLQLLAAIAAQDALPRSADAHGSRGTQPAEGGRAAHEFRMHVVGRGTGSHDGGLTQFTSGLLDRSLPYSDHRSLAPTASAHTTPGGARAASITPDMARATIDVPAGGPGEQLGGSHDSTLSEGQQRQQHVAALLNARTRYPRGFSPLMLAAKHGHVDVVRWLLTQGVDPWISDCVVGRTALHWAALEGHAHCVSELLRHLPPQHATKDGVRYVDARSHHGYTALHCAIAARSLAAAKALLPHSPDLLAANWSLGWDLAVRCSGATTPLHYAAEVGNFAIVRELLRYYVGAQLKVESTLRQQRIHGHNMAHLVATDPRRQRDGFGSTPAQVAGRCGYSALALILDPSLPLRIPGRLVRQPSLIGNTSAASAAMADCGVPRLRVLASLALRSKLLEECADDVGGCGSSGTGVATGRRGGPGKAEALANAWQGLSSAAGERPACVQLGVGGEGEEAGEQCPSEEADACGVCFEELQGLIPVSVAGCGHRLCRVCAGEVVKAGGQRPPRCPFCRGVIAAYHKVGIAAR